MCSLESPELRVSSSKTIYLKCSSIFEFFPDKHHPVESNPNPMRMTKIIVAHKKNVLEMLLSAATSSCFLQRNSAFFHSKVPYALIMVIALDAARRPTSSPTLNTRWRVFIVGEDVGRRAASRHRHIKRKQL
ncbi:uncharacterized protein LOC127566127 [Drosophila albomicans]|uniref:Uncharacterized protein LOC127566127 n=1 Tax=Drosophila albomicans TaxID=7291 RepID=A0A9C6SXQ2_DROAB|nr:uncharacterized protein LOC127566127 [Drosophila albomicans]